MIFKNITLLFLLLFFIGCETKQPEMTLKLVEWHEVPNFKYDNFIEALPAIKKSCTSKYQPKNYKAFCDAIVSLKHQQNMKNLRYLLQTHFQPYAIYLDNETLGKMTGYYEPLIRGSFHEYGPYNIPVYKNPKNFGLNTSYTRDEINAGALAKKDLELLWVDDAIDLFFLQIQGSGRVLLDNGDVVRIGYDGQNGQPYFPIGKALVENGELKLQDASMQNIKNWLRSHPSEMKEVLSLNQSYVYFKILGEEGPIGSQQTVLSPHRSLAIDPKFIPLGTLIWVDAEHPNETMSPIQKLMIAQDTGGAIKGALRGDYFWGYGQKAELYAGKMNSKARFFVFLPRKYQVFVNVSTHNQDPLQNEPVPRKLAH